MVQKNDLAGSNPPEGYVLQECRKVTFIHQNPQAHIGESDAGTFCSVVAFFCRPALKVGQVVTELDVTTIEKLGPQSSREDGSL